MQVHVFSSQEIGVKYDSELIGVSDDTLAMLRQKIFNSDVVLIKNFLPLAEARLLRELAHRLFCETQPDNPAVEHGVTKNHWRFDNNPEKSRVKCISRQFRCFYWNEEPIPGLLLVMNRLARFRNIFSGLREDFALEREEEEHVSVPLIGHYPRGGGYMQKHSDPESIQKAVFMIKLSKLGIDYKDGGLYVDSDLNGESVSLDQHLDPGDLYVIKPSCQHGVAPVDPEAALDLQDNSGRWTLMSTLVLTSSL
tara:strand:- start:3794 stop:4549 length:756 start_codon:yes stop_codon:yes gene_type:complete